MLRDHIQPVLLLRVIDIESDHLLHGCFQIGLEKELIVDVVDVIVLGNPFIDNWLDGQLFVQIFVLIFPQVSIEEKTLLSTSLMHGDEKELTVVSGMAADHNVWVFGVLKEQDILLLFLTQFVKVKLHVLEFVRFLALLSADVLHLGLASLLIALWNLVLRVEEALVVLMPGWPTKFDPHQLIIRQVLHGLDVFDVNSFPIRSTLVNSVGNMFVIVTPRSGTEGRFLIGEHRHRVKKQFGILKGILRIRMIISLLLDSIELRLRHQTTVVVEIVMVTVPRGHANLREVPTLGHLGLELLPVFTLIEELVG